MSSYVANARMGTSPIADIRNGKHEEAAKKLGSTW